MSEWSLIVADIVVVAGTIALTLAVLGVLRIPDPNAKLHAATKGVVLGALVILAASIPGGSGDIIARAILVGVLLLTTSAASTHALGKLQARLAEPAESNE